MFISFDALLKRMEEGHNWTEKINNFFNVSKHVDHFKTMKLFPLGKKQK